MTEFAKTDVFKRLNKTEIVKTTRGILFQIGVKSEWSLKKKKKLQFFTWDGPFEVGLETIIRLRRYHCPPTVKALRSWNSDGLFLPSAPRQNIPSPHSSGSDIIHGPFNAKTATVKRTPSILYLIEIDTDTVRRSVRGAKGEEISLDFCCLWRCNALHGFYVVWVVVFEKLDFNFLFWKSSKRYFSKLISE